MKVVGGRGVTCTALAKAPLPVILRMEGVEGTQDTVCTKAVLAFACQIFPGLLWYNTPSHCSKHVLQQCPDTILDPDTSAQKFPSYLPGLLAQCCPPPLS